MLIDMLPLYVEYLRSKRRARTTQHTYRSDVCACLKWLGISCTPADFTYERLLSFQEHYTKSHRPRSEHTVVFALRSFGDFLVQKGHITENPAKRLMAPGPDPVVREYVTELQVAHLWAATEKVESEFDRILSRAIVATLNHSGVRRAELLALNLSDFKPHEKSLYVGHGKGDKARTLYPNQECLTALQEYLKMRPDCIDPGLFAIDSRRRLGNVGLRLMLQNLTTLAGYRGQRIFLPHTLRHAYATRLMRAGEDIETIRKILGHSSILTTMLYLHTDEQKLRAAAASSALLILPQATPQPPAAAPPVSGVKDPLKPRSKRTSLR